MNVRTERMPMNRHFTKLRNTLSKTAYMIAGQLGRGKSITKTCLYNFDPLKSHFYIVKLGFRGAYIISAQNIDCGYSLEPPR